MDRRPTSLEAAQIRACEIFNLECEPEELALFWSGDSTERLDDARIAGLGEGEVIIVKLEESRSSRRKYEVRAEETEEVAIESEGMQDGRRAVSDGQEGSSAVERRIWERLSTPPPVQSTTATRTPVTPVFSPLTPSP